MFIIKDGFYSDPMSVRANALAMDYGTTGNYPGFRTAALTHDAVYFNNMKDVFSELVGEEITYWPAEYNTAYQYTTKDSKTWTHHDNTTWAAVIYLTPNAPKEAGTAIYRNKHSGIYRYEPESLEPDYNEVSHKEEDWEILDQASNVFNRLVLYHGSLYHRSVVPGFGNSKYDGRLFQTFFFSTK
jgi:hypothetical protein